MYKSERSMPATSHAHARRALATGARPHQRKPDRRLVDLDSEFGGFEHAASMHADTLLVHAGEPRPRTQGAVAMPIFQSSTFEEGEAHGYHDIRYARLSNTPTHEALHAKPPAPAGAEAALAPATRTAAITARPS